MDEQTTPKEQRTATQDNNAGSKSSTDMEIERVRSERERLAAENDAYEAEKLRAEKLRSEKILGGGSLAGEKEKTVQDLAQEEADKIVKAFK